MAYQIQIHEKPWACWRCNQLNAEWATECGRCGQPMKHQEPEQQRDGP